MTKVDNFNSCELNNIKGFFIDLPWIDWFSKTTYTEQQKPTQYN